VTPITRDTSLAEAEFPSFSRAWTLTFILFLAGVVSSVDRGILNLVIDPVRRELMISDVQISLLQGLSFSLFFASVGIPLGLVADRVQRRLLLSIGITVWSLATILGGLAPSYGWMFASRLLVGIGEATLGPCALSMISDAFPATRRGRPLGLHMLGGAISAGIAVMMVGFILAHAAQGAFDFFPPARGVSPWRIAFVVAGCVGFIVAAMLLAQREPRRRGMVIGASDGLGLRRTLGYLVENRGVLLPFYLGFAMAAVSAWAIMGWSAVFLMRHYHLAVGTLGQTLGLVSIIAGAIGAFTPGLVIDLMAGRYSRTAKFAALIALPFVAMPAAFAVLAPNFLAAILLFAFSTMLFPGMTTVVLSVFSDIMPNNMRAVSVSLLGLSSSVFGAITGPLLVATATEHLFHDSRMVGYSIMLVVAPALILSSAFYALSYLRLKANIARKGSLSVVLLAGG
jgi:MFS family permease